MKKNQSRRLAVGVALGVNVAWPTFMALREYDLPLAIALCIAGAMGLHMISAVLLFAARLGETVHRCPEPGCSFEVRVADADAVEARRWQEIAADHPHPYRP